jgi:hypothetical protein
LLGYLSRSFYLRAYVFVGRCLSGAAGKTPAAASPVRAPISPLAQVQRRAKTNREGQVGQDEKMHCPLPLLMVE